MSPLLLVNPKVLSKHPLWHYVLFQFKKRNYLGEGTLSKLQISLPQFSRLKKLYPAPRGYQLSYQRGLDLAVGISHGRDGAR